MTIALTQTEFNKDLLAFLQEMGYSHILSLGAAPAENAPEGYRDDYRLTPLKPDDPRLNFEELDLMIEPIQANDVKDMAAADEFIRFIIEMPVTDFELYIQSRNR